MWNTFRCELCGTESDEKPTIIRFSYKLTNGTPGVELIYLCGSCSASFPKTNPTRRMKIIELFKSLYPNRDVIPD